MDRVVHLIVAGLIACLFASVSCKSFENVPDEVVHRVKRIVNGESVELGEWGWLVHLEASVKICRWWIFGCETKTVRCGGTIIDNRWVLTAAHCVDDEEARWRSKLEGNKVFHVTSGDVDWRCTGTDWIEHWWARATGNTANRCHIHGTRIVRHPGYTLAEHRDRKQGGDPYFDYDFALMELEADILDNDYTDKLDPCTMTGSTEWPTDGDTGHVHGWGCTSIGGSTSNTANQAELPIRSNAYCAREFGPSYDTTSHICAGGSGASVCNGDSGGPLVVRTRTGNGWCQAGVVSWFIPRTAQTDPSGFARVTAVRDWIRYVSGV